MKKTLVVFTLAMALSVHAFIAHAESAPDPYTTSDSFMTSEGAFFTMVTLDPAGFAYTIVSNETTSAVPEPETYTMLLAGLGVIGFFAKRRKA